jgi:hypothetical protein
MKKLSMMPDGTLNEEYIAKLNLEASATQEEVATEVIRLKAEYDANQYQRDRQYPSIADQLDMQYHDQLDGTTTWKDAIAKVKSDNPKE